MDRIIIGNLKIPLRHELQEVFAAAEKSARKNGITVSNPVIYKKSLDARKKSDIHYVYSVAADATNIKGGSLPGGFQLAGAAGTLDMKELCAKALGSERIAELMFGADGAAARSRSENNFGADGAAARSRSENNFGADGAAARSRSENNFGAAADKDVFADLKGKRVLVVGSGPCGLFAAYILSRCGLMPNVIERGSDVDTRCRAVRKFWETGVLDPNTNVQFGEGGAGTFSDGKLNTRIGDPLQRFVLGIFAENGAPQDILYQAKPHIGTDMLSGCVRNIRNKIIQNGGRVLFDTCLTDIDVKDGRVRAAELNGEGFAECDAIIAALGHSSRDTYEMLYRRGAAMEQKPFAAGVRIEHSREFINRMQYGAAADTEPLPTADYRLAYNGSSRSCYSFCMCPGGVVVNASSEPGHLVVNGMSNYSRMADNSNSALVVTVRPADFENGSPLAGMEFQRKYEALAFAAANGSGPIQLARDFVAGKLSDRLCGVVPSFTGKTEFADLRSCLPEFISETLCEGLQSFEHKINGFLSGGAVMTGVEMRTSAPLRIVRGTNRESVSIKGLFPAGEGAGYAGGIMSAAIDGIRVACNVIEMLCI